MIIFTNNMNLDLGIIKPGNKFFNVSSAYPARDWSVDCTNLLTCISGMNNSGFPTNEFVLTQGFDVIYYSSIINDVNLFMSFMSIMYNDFNGQNSICLVERDPYRDAIMESIIKIIQNRYGANAWIVQDNDDLRCCHDTFYSPDGLLMLQNDVDRYTTIATNSFGMELKDL